MDDKSVIVDIDREAANNEHVVTDPQSSAHVLGSRMINSLEV